MLKFIDIQDQTGRTSAVEASSPDALEVVGGIRHCDKIQPKTVADAEKLISWLNAWIKARK